MSAVFGVIDLFAGPGGLGEGFTSFRSNGLPSFRLQVSIEKEVSAHQTLRLRSFLRGYAARHGVLPRSFLDFHAGATTQPEWHADDPEAWKQAMDEALCLELGTQTASEAIENAFRKIPAELDDTILIGGPPCQAYSVIGRVRARGKADYIPENDRRHYLFREYLAVLNRLRPAAFVMENVRGMLSSRVERRLVFDMLMDELSSLGSGKHELYRLHAVRVDGMKASLQIPNEARDFVVRAEDFGVPQRRHRVIIVGIRADLASGASAAHIQLPGENTTIRNAIGNLPPVRSGVSREHDDTKRWQDIVGTAARFLARSGPHESLRHVFAHLATQLQTQAPLQRSSTVLPPNYGRSSESLLRWLERPQLLAMAQHETRSHMATDLGRYLFTSVYGRVFRYSPGASDFPVALHPDHRNWKSGAFSDRFRVQIAEEPSTTITSHNSKDGHYYIHHDPLQCRSLTVREAARLQTFPDDYLFLGNRTQQYIQVGNAVPPLLARRIAELLHAALAGPHAEGRLAGTADTSLKNGGLEVAIS